jgi:phage N-6-adenine-methyltransferase
MSLVGFSARNHPQQAVRDEVDDRRTPRDVFGPLDAVHRFTIDVAASDKNHLVDRYYTRYTDAFLHSWAGERVWCNPPFSRLMPWLEKTWAEMRGGCELVVMLIPANRCEQPFWQRHVEPYRDAPPRDGIALRTRFLKDRARFTAPDVRLPVKGDRPPFGCVVLTWTRE